MWSVRNAQRECTVLFDIFCGLAIFLNIERNHVIGTDPSQGRVFAVRAWKVVDGSP